MQKLQAHQLVKRHGLSSLRRLSELAGVSRNTLGNWYRNKPELFEVVILGALRKADLQAQTPGYLPDAPRGYQEPQ